MTISPFQKVLIEKGQGPETRKQLFRKLERELKKPVVTFYTSFFFPVIVSPEDVQMLEGILQTIDLSNGLVLIVSSPGGDPLAAEGIIKVCRTYSKTGAFTAVVPGQAKSAATMICMGAEQVIMGPASELGPVDPQVARVEKGRVKWFSAVNLVNTYESLFAGANKTKGNLEPYLQQLQAFDAAEIGEFKAAIKLSEDIAVKALGSGMMSGKTDAEIKDAIKVFLEPEKGKLVHGRAIHREEATKCGLKVDSWNQDHNLWKLVYELHVRTSTMVAESVSKIIETRTSSYFMPKLGIED